jgi:uncharacterized protein (UPF0264 family)
MTAQDGTTTGLLASVASVDEAGLAIGLGADIVDLKDPAQGALGAWAVPELGRAVARWGGSALLSATTGDLPMAPAVLARAAAAVAASGVALVKVGFFAGGDPAACARGLAPLAGRGVRLVAVMMADQRPDPGLLEVLAEARFAGAMLDTADKRAGGLRQHWAATELASFVDRARALGLMTGLAGSLRLADIPPLLALRPDYLGFRGALCRGDRAGALDAAAFAAVRAAVPARRPAA